MLNSSKVTANVVEEHRNQEEVQIVREEIHLQKKNQAQKVRLEDMMSK